MKFPKTKLIAEEYNVNLFTWSCITEGFFSAKIKKYIGRSFDYAVFIFDGDRGQLGIEETTWNDLGQRTLAAIDKKHSFVRELLQQSIKEGKMLIALCQRISSRRLEQATDQDLQTWFHFLFEHYARLSCLGLIPVLSDYHHGYLTAALETIVKKNLPNNARRSVQEYVSTLSSTPFSTWTSRESLELLQLACALKKRGRSAVSDEEILMQKHAKKFFWVFYGYQGPVSTIAMFRERLHRLLRKSATLEEDYRRQVAEQKKLPILQRTMVKELLLTSREKRLFEAARIFMYLKAYRIDVRSYVNYTFDSIFRELGRRYGIALQEFRFATIQEIKTFLRTKRMPNRADIQKRRFFCVHPWVKKQRIFLYGDASQKFMKHTVIHERIEAVTEIQGQVASLGKVRGIVKIVNTVTDIKKVNHGDILVSIATSPDLLPAMYRAAAFVTDTGGITSHAAIISREMRKPCIIGTKIATKIFKDGDRVEVDAERGIVKKIP